MLALVCAAEFLVVGAIAIVAIALPAIGRDLDAGPVALQWVLTAYVLCFGGLLLLGGRFGDVLGPGRVMMLGLALFGAASLACGAAGSLAVLIAARAAQGAGAALLTPTALAIVAALHRDRARRARAVAAWTAAQAGGAATGWVLGGALTQSLGWRAVFLAPVPVVVALLLLARRLLRDELAPRSAEPVDVAGAVTVTGSVALAILALTQLGVGGPADPLPWAALAGSVALLLLFVAAERRAVAPIVPLAALRSRSLAAANLGALAFQAATNAPLLLCILALQDLQRRTPVETGLAFAPFNAAVIAASLAGGRLLGRAGHGAVLAGGLGAIVAANLLLTRLAVTSAYADTVLPAFLLMGLGVGAAAVASTSLATSSVRRDRQGLAGGLVNTTGELGYALGLALLVTLAAATTGAVADGGPAEPADVLAGYDAAFVAAAGATALAVPVSLALLSERGLQCGARSRRSAG